MSEEIKMDWSRFETALQRRLATSSRDHLLVLSDQARGILRKVVEITPPGTKGVNGLSRAARAMGQAAVERDIRSLYGTASGAYDTIRQRDEAAAAAFWANHKAGDTTAASAILRAKTGTGLHKFDGGTLHKRHQNRRGRVRSKRVIFYVDDERDLDAYIKGKQKRVNFLQAGWKAAFAKLGLPLPVNVSGHEAPSTAVIEVTATRLRILAVNAVNYASNTDLERRIQWAINGQAGSMERQMEKYMENLNRRAGL
jgi:hypothetical protein